MKIAAITLTYNDGYKINEWQEHYAEHKNTFYKHIIVDNHSDPAYLADVKRRFPDSIIIERSSNGGCTGAYNTGIQRALSFPEVDSILLLGNDIRISFESIEHLYNYLFSDKKMGMVAPIVMEKDSDIVMCYGCRLLGGTASKFIDKGRRISDVTIENQIVDWVPGGINLAKRSFYETVGLQDENLFMYYDEIDMCYRAKAKGWLEGVTKSAVAWHQHINPKNGMRDYKAYKICSRNEIYINRKHCGLVKTYSWGIWRVFHYNMLYIYGLIRRDKKKRIIARLYLSGLMLGIRGNMDNTRFI